MHNPFLMSVVVAIKNSVCFELLFIGIFWFFLFFDLQKVGQSTQVNLQFLVLLLKHFAPCAAHHSAAEESQNNAHHRDCHLFARYEKINRRAHYQQIGRPFIQFGLSRFLNIEFIIRKKLPQCYPYRQKKLFPVAETKLKKTENWTENSHLFLSRKTPLETGRKKC